MREPIEVGYEAFVSDQEEKFGAIRAVSPRELTVWVEHAGDFTVPIEAVVSVQSEKVTFDCSKLNHELRVAIGHAHDAEV